MCHPAVSYFFGPDVPFSTLIWGFLHTLYSRYREAQQQMQWMGNGLRLWASEANSSSLLWDVSVSFVLSVLKWNYLCFPGYLIEHPVVNKLFKVYGTRVFITAITKARCSTCYLFCSGETYQPMEATPWNCMTHFAHTGRAEWRGLHCVLCLRTAYRKEAK